MDVLVAVLGLVSVEIPDLSDRYRFPPREFARESMQFNRSYRQHIQAIQWVCLQQVDAWQHVIEETDYCFSCWDWLHAVQGGDREDVEYQLYSLKRLRELLGDEAYFSGRMPDCVPLWRFRHF